MDINWKSALLVVSCVRGHACSHICTRECACVCVGVCACLCVYWRSNPEPHALEVNTMELQLSLCSCLKFCKKVDVESGLQKTAWKMKAIVCLNCFLEKVSSPLTHPTPNSSWDWIFFRFNQPHTPCQMSHKKRWSLFSKLETQTLPGQREFPGFLGPVRVEREKGSDAID